MGQLLQRRDLAKYLACWPSRAANDHRSGIDDRHDAGLRAHPRFRPDPHVLGDSGLTADHHKVADLDRTRNPNLRGDGAVPTDTDVMSDLYQVIETGARTNHRVAQRTAVDRGVGADFHVVFQDHTAELRRGQETLLGDGKAKPFLADPCARINIDPCPSSAWLMLACEPMRQSGPSTTPSPITALGPTWQRGPISACAPITACAQISAVGSIVAPSPTMAEEWMPAFTHRIGWNSAATRAQLATGSVVTSAIDPAGTRFCMSGSTRYGAGVRPLQSCDLASIAKKADLVRFRRLERGET